VYWHPLSYIVWFYWSWYSSFFKPWFSYTIIILLQRHYWISILQQPSSTVILTHSHRIQMHHDLIAIQRTPSWDSNIVVCYQRVLFGVISSSSLPHFALFMPLVKYCFIFVQKNVDILLCYPKFYIRCTIFYIHFILVVLLHFMFVLYSLSCFPYFNKIF